MKDSRLLEEKAKKIKLLLLDVDGILTDGKIIIDGSGNELKAFHIHDGHGIYLLMKEGIRVGIISGRASKATERRAAELNIEDVYLAVHDKVKAHEEMLEKYNLRDEDVAFMGDELIDIPLLKRVGLSATVPDAIEDVKKVVDMITQRRGGEGAVREVIDFLLKAKRRR